MKAFTDIEQSKKLADILPLESADMYWWYNGQKYYAETIEHNDFQKRDIRAWSLAALLNLLPDYTLNRCVEYHTIICNGLTDTITAHGFTLIDACVEMIEKLDKEGYFR